jgi:hypothetical protein
MDFKELISGAEDLLVMRYFASNLTEYRGLFP